MTNDVARLRLQNQGVAAARFDDAAEAARWFGAVQAQDYPGSLWALGLRVRGASEASVERAVADGSIVRTWPLRGTLHFAAAEDVRWMLELTGARAIARAATRYRQLGLDEATFARSRRVLEGALGGGRRLTRAELADALERRGVATEGQRLIHILNRSALEGLTCYAARRGKQFTFALLDEWAPSAKRLTREEALAELAGRYFQSHGPATVEDFVWWSGLATADAWAGLRAARPRLLREVFDGRAHWLSPTSAPAAEGATAAARLLPAFDEYTVAYRDRGAILHKSYARLPSVASAILGPAVVLGGSAVGLWKRTLKRGSVVVETNLWTTLGKAERRALEEAARVYGEYLGLSAVMA